MGTATVFVVCLLCLFLVNGKVAKEERVCGINWQYFNGYCYSWYSRTNKRYEDSEKQCQELKSSLARVERNETLEFLRKNVLKSRGSFWTGLHRCNFVKFFWTDGTPMKYANFAENEPNNDKGNEDCVELYADTSWNDQKCSLRREFICQNMTCLTKTSHLDSCYYKYKHKETWDEAKLLCEAVGDVLVKIDNSVTNTLVRNLAGGLSSWIGLRRRDYFCLPGGIRAKIDKKLSRCQDNINDCNCVAMNGDGSLSEVSCRGDLPYVCEKDANRCVDSESQCHVNAVCTNTIGSYTCRCKDSFIGNGKICKEPKNFDITLIDTRDTDEVKSVIKSCTRMLRTQNQAEILIKILENITVSVGQHMNNSETTKFVMDEEDIILGVFRVQVKDFQGLKYPENVRGLSNNEDNIAFPPSILSPTSGDSAVVIGMVYNTPNEMNTSHTTVEGDWFVNSKVIGGIVDPKPAAFLSDPVKMNFKMLKHVKNAKVKCAFWEFNDRGKGAWSTEGCYVISHTGSQVSCECYHLTNFAILMKVNTDQSSAVDDPVLDIITYVGLSASILGCLLTLVIHLYFRKLRKGRGFIHINLVIALGLADIAFFVAIFTDHDNGSCLALAIIVLYFFLSLFFWMLVEGLHIYLMVKKIFNITGKRIKYSYCAIGWFFPLVIVSVSYGVLRSEFLSDEYCWLATESGAIWAFVGPITFIILVNVIIMMLVLKVTVTMLPDDPENGKILSAFRTFLMLTPILGVTWIFGILTITKESKVFQYLFAILNSFQGLVIFILYCVFNKEARREFQRKLKTIRSSREISISRKKSTSSSKEKGGTSRSSVGSSFKKNSEFDQTPGRYTPWYVFSTDPNNGELNQNDGFENDQGSPAQRRQIKQIEYPLRRKCDVTGKLFGDEDEGENTSNSVPEVYPLEKSQL